MGGALRPAMEARSVTGTGMSLRAAAGNPDVEAHADDRRRRAERIAVQLDQDAADLEVTVDEVVRPLERDVLEALGLERAHDGDADRERQPGEKPRALLELPPQREREAAAGDRGPGAPAAAASRRLPFGGERDPMDVAALRPPHELGGRRLDLVDDLDRAAAARSPLAVGKLGELRPHLLRIEELRRLEQPVAAALDPLQRQPGRPGVLQDLGNTGARQPHLGGKVLAGMELPIGKLAQQRESKRSEHL